MGRLTFIFSLLLTVSMFPTVCRAGTGTREQMRILCKYDFRPDTAAWNKPADAAEFWRQAMLNSVSYNTSLNAAKKGKARKIQQRIGESVDYIRENYLNEEYPSSIVSLLDSAFVKSGINKVFPKDAGLYLDPADASLSYSLPDGSVYLSYGLLKELDFEPDLILAAYIHELSHFVLQHTFLHLYRIQRKSALNVILNEMLSIVTIGSAKFADVSLDAVGIKTYLTRNAIDYSRSRRRSTPRQGYVEKMKYTRDLEFEADIVAVRFMEFSGTGVGPYIRMIEKRTSPLERFRTDDRIQPLSEERIELIKLMVTNPELKPVRLASDDDIYGY